ncbi:MAG: hypothetical protein NZ811_02800 [Gammaproteobacteria bacterium]|nr:hypothetical protein [Gammaproteobacteria bacterium]
MEFYIQACIDLKLNELFCASKSTSKMDWNLVNVPSEDMFQDGLEVHVPGETTTDIAFEDRHVFINYLVSGDFESLDMQDCSCPDGELIINNDDYTILMSGPVGEILPNLSVDEQTVEGEVVL